MRRRTTTDGVLQAPPVASEEPPLPPAGVSTRLEPMDVIAGPDAPGGAPPRVSFAGDGRSEHSVATPRASCAMSEQNELRPAWCVLAAPLAISLAVSVGLAGRATERHGSNLTLSTVAL